MDRAERADMLHREGYNCCQAVACVFAEDVGMDMATMYKVAEGFGGGMGTAKGVCGAVSGAAIVAGLLYSDGNYEDAGNTKAKTTKAAGTVQRKFVEEAKGLICKDIKTGNNGGPFTSCTDCIKIAVRAAEEVFGL
ncbi:MAG: C_GCAxxG_C_C family protein [Mogibacterium sp.]|nr:C_GCAxxG_C_C family protein [Mogibacterium sp.]MBR2540729.1 C_GCAxxG_C_C family protein [Mogibacterium sp.]